jgi:hypothetical protein
MASISGRRGMEGAVPGRVTEMPATTQANLVASVISMPSAKAVARPPLKASPAPVVSTAGPATTAGMCWVKVLFLIKAPWTPRVRITLRTPRLRRDAAAFSAEARSVTEIPVRVAASVSFGVR